MEIYVVKSGDTVDSIAESHGISVSSLIYDNQLVYPYPLALGQALLLSAGDPSPSYPAWVNGYAYPFPFFPLCPSFPTVLPRTGSCLPRRLTIPLWSAPPWRRASTRSSL